MISGRGWPCQRDQQCDLGWDFGSCPETREEISQGGNQSCIYNGAPKKPQTEILASFSDWQCFVRIGTGKVTRPTPQGEDLLLVSWTLPCVRLPMVNFNLRPFLVITVAMSIIVFREFCES